MNSILTYLPLWYLVMYFRMIWLKISAPVGVRLAKRVWRSHGSVRYAETELSASTSMPSRVSRVKPFSEGMLIKQRFVHTSLSLRIRHTNCSTHFTSSFCPGVWWDACACLLLAAQVYVFKLLCHWCQYQTLLLRLPSHQVPGCRHEEGDDSG